MNRPLKFRAWDNVTYKMHYVGECDEIAFGFDSTGIVAWDLTTDEQNLKELCHLVYMQSTGLKDKNGTEIYEGSILKITDDNGEFNLFDSNTGIGEIQWYIDCWYVSKVHNGLYDLLSEYEVEVIGNIYRDKNLLEVD